MAKGIIEKAIEQSVLIFVREGARKVAKQALGKAEGLIQKVSDKKKARRLPEADAAQEVEESID